jgi:hypothetical protein
MALPAPYPEMPGTFIQSDYHAGPKSHLFQPPRTPSASSSLYLSRSTMSLVSDADHYTVTSRKRTRHEYCVESNATPNSVMADWSNGMGIGDPMAISDCPDPGSPMPFVNTRYQLAGGLDAPSAAAAREADQSEYSEVAYRKRLSGEVNGIDENDNNIGYLAQASTTQFTDSNGRARMPNPAPQREGWGRLAIDVVGSVVGKVWEFCKAGAFRGFSAGGGKSYDIQTGQPHTPIQNNFWQGGEQQAMMLGELRERESTPIPGQFIDEDFVSDNMDRYQLELTPPRATKRRQLDKSDSDLTHNWVMVPNSGSAKRMPAPQTKAPTRHNISTASTVNRRLNSTAPTRPVLRANGRRPIIPSRTSVSHAGSPGLNPARPASFASPRSPGGSRIPVPSNTSPISNKNIAIVAAGGTVGVGSRGNGPVNIASTTSPASIEVQRWAAKRRQEEKEADEAMRKLNAQLKAMIREGKEALGTKVEVELDDAEELSMEDLVDDGLQGQRFQGRRR